MQKEQSTMNTLNTLSVRIVNVNREALAMSYLALGASNHQMPRNAMPMNRLVLNTLNTGEHRALTAKEIAAKLSGFGFRVKRSYVSDTLSALNRAGMVLKKRDAAVRRMVYWF